MRQRIGSFYLVIGLCGEGFVAWGAEETSTYTISKLVPQPEQQGLETALLLAAYNQDLEAITHCLQQAKEKELSIITAMGEIPNDCSYIHGNALHQAIVGNLARRNMRKRSSLSQLYMEPTLNSPLESPHEREERLQQIVDILVQNGCPVSEQNGERKTPLHYACDLKSDWVKKAVRRMMQQSDPNITQHTMRLIEARAKTINTLLTAHTDLTLLDEHEDYAFDKLQEKLVILHLQTIFLDGKVKEIESIIALEKLKVQKM